MRLPPRRAHRVDANQREIVDGLQDQRVGAKVDIIGWPVDLLVHYHGRLILLEVKREGGKVRASQWKYVQECQARGEPVYIVYSLADALQSISALN